MSQPRHVLALIGQRLIATDSLTPILLELQAERPGMSFDFLVVDRRWFATLQANVVLYSALSSLGRFRFLSDGTGSRLAKVRAGLRLLRHLLMVLLRPTILFGYADFGPFPYGLLARCTRLRGGRVILHAKPPYPFAPDLRQQYQAMVDGKDVRMRDPGDVFLLFHPDQVQDYAAFTTKEPRVIGTPRIFPRWCEYLDKFRRESGLPDWHGVAIEPEGRLVLTMSYIGALQSPLTFTVSDARTLARRFLDAVREVVPEALLIIKPHPLTDMAMLRDDLKDFADLDIRVSMVHPQLLARVSVVGVFPHPSTVIDDFYVEGRPVIDILDYPPEVADGPGLFPNPAHLSAPTPERIRAVLRQVVAGDLPVPDTHHLCHPKVASVASVLEIRPS